MATVFSKHQKHAIAANNKFVPLKFRYYLGESQFTISLWLHA